MGIEYKIGGTTNAKDLEKNGWELDEKLFQEYISRYNYGIKKDQIPYIVYKKKNDYILLKEFDNNGEYKIRAAFSLNDDVYMNI